jgi:hypothetical protein
MTDDERIEIELLPEERALLLELCDRLEIALRYGDGELDVW